MAQALKRDSDLGVAARQVLKRVKAADLSEALIDGYGDRLVIEIWHQHVDKLSLSSEKTSPAATPPGSVAPMGWRVDEHRHLPGRTANNGAVRAIAQVQQRGMRRVDVDQLKCDAALLEALFCVDGRWMRLGDLNKRQCQGLQLKHQEIARAFSYLAAGLREDQIVRQRWTVEQIERVMGETLRAAASARPTR